MEPLIEKTAKESTDRYEDVVAQIVEVIYTGSNYKFGEDVQKKIIDILKNNFDIRYEDMGRNLIQDIRMFDYRNGYEFETPLFVMPVLSTLGVMMITPERFPNYSIDNKYIGYTDNEIFYRINDFTLFMRYVRKQPLAVIILFLMIYLVVVLFVPK
jgi:hypothetical protein